MELVSLPSLSPGGLNFPGTRYTAGSTTLIKVFSNPQTNTIVKSQFKISAQRKYQVFDGCFYSCNQHQHWRRSICPWPIPSGCSDPDVNITSGNIRERA